MRQPRQPRCYFSLRSPYSWLAYRELLDRYADVAERVEWVPFWEPDEESTRLLAELGGSFPYVAMSRAKHLYILQDVARIAQARGLSLTWPIDRAPVWEVPHLGYLIAQAANRGPEYIAAAYRARWEQGRDICDRATVVDIGTSLGLDPDELARASENPVLRARGAEILLRICRDGVFGVPFFVHGFSRYWGVERLAEFAAHLRQDAPPGPAMPPPVAAAAGPGRLSEEGHAGGCG
jgi:2-hydroxychromene-2-carboxylate isomerase